MSESDALFDVLLELRKAGLDELLLGCVELSDGVDLLYAVGAEGDLGREEGDALVFVQGRLDKGRGGLHHRGARERAIVSGIGRILRQVLSRKLTTPLSPFMARMSASAKTAPA